MIREQIELESLLEVFDLNKDKLGKFTLQMNPSKFHDGNVDITICILNKKKKVIEYIDIYEDISVKDAEAKAVILNDWFIEDLEFTDFYNRNIEENYNV